MKDDKQQPSFRTHIAEPRWQQVVSVVIVLGFVIVWCYFAFFSR